MSVGGAVESWIRGAGAELVGWALIPVGIILMPLPGPGMLIVVSGVALLARRHVWAQRMLGPLQRRAIDAAKYGVATIPRIAMSVFGGIWLIAVGFVWWRSPTIPEFTLLGAGF